MAWELMNEPRSNGDFSASKLQAWIEQTAEFLKSIDPHHLVTVGSEGFFGSSTPGAAQTNPPNGPVPFYGPLYTFSMVHLRVVL